MNMETREEQTDKTLIHESITPTSLLKSLDQFITLVAKLNDRRNFSVTSRGSSHERSGNQEENQLAIQSALDLLQNLPSARAPALSYLAQALSKQVWQLMQRKGAPPMNKDNSLEFQIESLLAELVESSPEIWGPLVARWAVDQLGRWSVEWEGVILGRGDATLEERVANWLSCSPVQSLANLTVSCVALDADNAVAALLETSLHSGPSLDWLVAHVGCSFPSTIVNRVLTLGLKSFSASTSIGHAKQQLVSVNNILNHLAERHFPDIKRGLQVIILQSLSSSPDVHSKAAIPYLLQLATNKRSRLVLKALTASLPHVLQQTETTSRLGEHLLCWVPKYFPTITELVELLVHLLLETDGIEASDLVGSLLHASVSQDQTLSNFASQILEHLLTELCTLTFSKQLHLPYKTHIPFVRGLGLHTKDNSFTNNDSSQRTIMGLIQWSIMSENEYAIKRLSQLISFLAMQQGQEVASSLLKQLLLSKLPVNNQLLFLINSLCYTAVSQHSSGSDVFRVLTRPISNNLDSNLDPLDILATVEKLKYVIIGNKTNKSYLQEALSISILSNIAKLAKVLNVPKIGAFVLELLGQFSFDKPMCLRHVFTLGHALVYYAFNSLKLQNHEDKLINSNMCNKLLAQLSNSSVGHSFLVRLIFEASYRNQWAFCMGSNRKIKFECKEPKDSLLRTNLQFDSWVKMPRSHNTIFHAGRIGNEPHRKRFKLPPFLDADVVALNTQLVLNSLSTCSRAQGTSQGSTTIALLLVEYVSPDIMFNGFPWPDENIKFTFERDLAIRKKFDDFPIAWHFLELVARNRPALCYCSVLVRALTAAYTAFWSTFYGNFASNNTNILRSTKRLLEIMVIGQFLPDTFSVLPQMVEHLAPHQIVCVLQDVWGYLRNHTPSPDRWVLLPSGIHDRLHEPPDPRYTDRCLKLILMHIEKLGHLLPSMMKHRPQSNANQ